MNALRSVLLASLAALGMSCRSGNTEPGAPPPDVSRPVLRTEAELADERERMIQSGEVVPADAPTFESERTAPAAESRPAAAPLVGSISSDILLVNGSVLTASEVLFLLRKELVEGAATLTPARFRERAERWVRDVAQQEIGVLLVYEKAVAGLDETRNESLDRTVETELDRIVNVEFGGSSARLSSELDKFNITLEQFRERLRRQIVVSSYTREIIAPKIQLRRDELLYRFEQQADRFSTPETRELLMIEAPFEKFLPDGLEWTRATSDQRARARLAAVRHIRAAAEALQTRPFRDVAAEFSRGAHASDGGSWGQIGAPLQAPYDRASQHIFDHADGRASAPIELVGGWCIVACGEKQAATSKTFLEVQDELREELFRERFNKLAGDYMLRLAEKATISSMDEFVKACVRRAERNLAPAAAQGS